MSTIDFLSGNEYQEAVTNIIKDPSPLKIAVSYWGNEILENLALVDRLKLGVGDVEVICDLGHIACRHEPIHELLQHGMSVKTIDRLHAKVWISETQVIVGSANASRSALRFLTNNVRNNEEAGTRITDITSIKNAKRWFENLWRSKACSDVTLAVIKRKIQHHSGAERKKSPMLVAL